jgi:lamin tail-like protein
MRHASALLLLLLAVAPACSDDHKSRRHDDDGGSDAGGDPSGGPSTSSGGGAGGHGGSEGGAGAGGASDGGGGSSEGGGGSGGTPVVPGDLVISEIMNNPAAVTDENGEWFEIYNTTAHAIDLTGFVLRHQPDQIQSYVIASPLVAQPHNYVVLGRSADMAVNGGVVVDHAYGSVVSLNNTSDYLSIETPAAVTIDETAWDELSGLDPDGHSRNLDAAAMDATMNDDDTFFCEATTSIPGSIDHGTPGAANDACP